MIAPTETVTKTIFTPCEYLTIKLKVLLGNKDQNRNRRKFMYAREYDTEKYSQKMTVSSVNVETKDFLILESVVPYSFNAPKNSDQSPHTVFFSYDNLHSLSWAMNQAYSWISNEDVFQCDKTNGELLNINPTYMNLVAVCESPHMKGYSDEIVKFSPTIRINKSTREKEKAIGIIMNQRNYQIGSLSLNEIASIIYFLDRFDLCSAAISVVNQVLVATPVLTAAPNKK